MKTRNMYLTGLMALALMLTMIPASHAKAAVVIRASIGTPHAGVMLGYNTVPAVRNTRYVHLRPLPVRRYAVLHITKHDRRMARRLADYTGVSRRELLRLRRQGYSWREIGSWLNVRPVVVRAARSARTWDDFLYGGRPVVRCRTHGHRH